MKPPISALIHLAFSTTICHSGFSGSPASIFRSRSTFLTPRMADWTMPGSTFQTSPPSMMMVGQPARQASRRNAPAGPLPSMMISAPNDSASRRTAGSLMSPRTLG